MASKKSRGLAAQAWCKDINAHKVLDLDLAEAFAEIMDKELIDFGVNLDWRDKLWEESHAPEKR